MTSHATRKLSQIAAQRSILRSRDLTALGISRSAIAGLVARGLLHPEGRGLYTLSGVDPTEKHSLALAAARLPQGVICLLSALVFHGLTAQNPSQVWVAIDGKARPPRWDHPPLRIIRASKSSLATGVETHRVEGIPVRVFSVAKTVADLFKYRNKVGLEVALEALREALQVRRTTADEVQRFAKICRVASVMRPYLESVL